MIPCFYLMCYNLGMKQKYYRNSDLKINRYFALPQFREQLLEAKSHGKECFYNHVRVLNNCYYARQLNGDVSIKAIFRKYWKEFKEHYENQLQRKGLIKSIETMISCHDFDNGFLYYDCPNCEQFYMIGFSCHSRFCPSCGQKYKNQRTIKVEAKVLNVPHRQFVFTIPEQLRNYFRKYHDLLNILFQSSKETLNKYLEHHAPKLYKKEKRRLGFISFLHTFGRDLKFHPHLHILIAERYLTNDGKLKKFDYFHFDYIRKTFQNVLFHNIYNYFKNVIKDRNLTIEIYKTLQSLKEQYPDGYYFYGPKMVKKHDTETIKDMKSLTAYIARYASHPAISERRILKFDEANRTITWYYDPHEDDDVEDEKDKKGRQIITEDVFEFMKRLIVHIPSEGFQQVRYYGFYSNKFKDKVTNNSLFTDAQLKKMLDNTYWTNGLKNSFGYDPTFCKCGHQMILDYSNSYFPTRGNST